MIDSRTATLEDFPLFPLTTDLDEARAHIASVFCWFELGLVGKDSHLRARQNSVRLDAVTLNYLDYGAEVRIVPGELESFFLVQLPLSGLCRVRGGSQEIVASPEMASVPSPTEFLDMHFAPRCPKLIVKLTRAAVEATVERLLGRPLLEPVVFDLGMPVTSGPGRAWFGLVQTLLADLAQPLDGRLTAQPVALAQLEQALITTLLLAQPSNYHEALAAEAPSAGPSTIRCAARLVEERAHEHLTTEQLAAAVCVSVRSLQRGFRSTFGMSPTEFLRSTRLRRARADLLASDPASSSVTAVATRWGFLHLGRFSQAYRQAFGESPSETLRRR